MSKVIAHMTMSLDGYAAGPDVSEERPMGKGGQRLHRWIFGEDPVDCQESAALFERTGAAVIGRGTFDVGLGQWEDTPFPVPTYVVTHRVRDPLPMEGGTFYFLPSLTEAVEAARKAAGGKTVTLMGPAVTQQAFKEGLLDELHLQLAPLLLGAGTPLFTGTQDQELRLLSSRHSSNVTHLRYAADRGPAGR